MLNIKHSVSIALRIVGSRVRVKPAINEQQQTKSIHLWWTLGWRGFMVVSLSLASCYAQTTFTDGFEGTSLNPWWTFVSYGPDYSPCPGCVASLDSSLAYTGAQSLRLSTPAWASQAYLEHVFPSPVYGTADVYVYDSLACCTGYKQLWLFNGPTPFDPTNPANQVYYIYWDWGYLTTVLATNVPGVTGGTLAPAYSSPGWRHWTIATSPGGVNIQIDGTTVFTTTTGFAFNALALANCCQTSTYANFDNFSFTQLPGYQVTLLYDPLKGVKSGATIPIKVELTDGAGHDVSSAGITCMQ
jgi:hypothetical protein